MFKISFLIIIHGIKEEKMEPELFFSFCKLKSRIKYKFRTKSSNMCKDVCCLICVWNLDNLKTTW